MSQMQMFQEGVSQLNLWSQSSKQRSATSENLQVCNLKSYLEKKSGRGSRLSACSGRGGALWCNISVQRIRVVWGEIRHRRITALLNVSARASTGTAAMQTLCQHSWGSTPAEDSLLPPLLPKLKEHLISEAHCSLSHHYSMSKWSTFCFWMVSVSDWGIYLSRN